MKKTEPIIVTVSLQDEIMRPHQPTAAPGCGAVASTTNTNPPEQV